MELNKTGSQNQIFGRAQSQNASAELMRHKAIKYHYKIQNLLNEKYVQKGIAVPSGYEHYLQSFQG